MQLLLSHFWVIVALV